MTLALYRLGRAAVRRRRLVLAAWVAAAVAVIGLASAFGGTPTDSFEIPGVEAQRAFDVLEDEFPAAAGTSAQLVFEAEGGADATLAEGAGAAAVEAAVADVADQPDVLVVTELQYSDDDRIAYADVQYSEPTPDIREEAFARLEATAASVADTGAARLELGGDLPSAAVEPEFGAQELIGIGVAMIVLLVAFGSFVAMGLPIGLALLGLMTSMGFIGLIAAVVEVSSAAPTIASMIGLGVGIDYALFIVTRHRENLQAGMTVEEAAARAIATSGAAVLFAGITVMIAITGLAIAGITLVTIMGLTAALSVAVMVAVSLTLLPALLGFAGRKVAGNGLRLPGRRRRAAAAATGTGTQPAAARETLWHRWGTHVAAHPWRYLVSGVAVLVLLTSPILSLRLGSPDNGTQAESLTTRQAYDLLADGFGAGFNGPFLLSVELHGDAAGDEGFLDDLSAAIAEDPGVESVSPARLNETGTAAVMQVIPTTSPQAKATTDLVHHLRDDVVPPVVASADVGAGDGDGADAVEVHVGGQTALFVDMSDKVQSRLPWFIGAVLVLSVLLLTVVFRSIAVPLKAAVMNLLSIGSAYGVIVAVFQWGWLRDVVGVETTIPIISFLPMMLFAILFGLSMDYEVFLLSRVREEYLHHKDNDRAVVEGIAATGRVITSAALIMISVFAAFVLSHDPTVKMFGLGLATAVLIDATIVRVVLVPATMKLLGDWNWWVPRWLDRILPRFDIEGGAGLPAPEMEDGVGRDEDRDTVEGDRTPVLTGA
jgi:RND superfamily putative drug exporter